MRRTENQPIETIRGADVIFILGPSIYSIKRKSGGRSDEGSTRGSPSDSPIEAVISEIVTQAPFSFHRNLPSNWSTANCPLTGI